MARRKRDSSFSGLLTILVVLALMGYVFNSTIKHLNEIGLVLGLIAFVYVSFRIIRVVRENVKRKSALIEYQSIQASLSKKAYDIVTDHLNVLARKKAQLVTRDDYGNVREDPYVKEVRYFLDTQVRPRLDSTEDPLYTNTVVDLTKMIFQRVDHYISENPQYNLFSDSLTAREYEIFCANQLAAAGWNAWTTPVGPDNGVDVIAEKNGKRVVLQCKLYSGAVGNKAVQEAAAARAHEKAHYAAVVTNSRFTSAAKKLASSNSVLLLHHSDLQDLFDRLD
jgi:restriction system protein